MIRIAIQTKGRLNEDSVKLLKDAGITFKEDKRKFLLKSANFPIEALYLRDDDIPEAVFDGTADIGIVGYNEVCEKELDVEIVKKLNFSKCRISLAVPKSDNYQSLDYFNGKRIATSYPNILSAFLKENNIDAQIRCIAGSVEIAPASGLADAIFDIVSSGATLVSNGLEEVVKVVDSEAVLICRKGLPEEKMTLVNELMFRFESVIKGRGMKYMLMNLPADAVEKAAEILPSLRSPTVMPLAQTGWYSMHSVVKESELWTKIAALKSIGAEGILVLDVEKIIL